MIYFVYIWYDGKYWFFGLFGEIWLNRILWFNCGEALEDIQGLYIYVDFNLSNDVAYGSD